jgi:ABC-type transport system involved in cytochrome c biogenesis permease subunit
MGLETHGVKRDRFSYNELQPGIPKLAQLDAEARQKEDKDLTLLDRQIMNLGENLMTFSHLRFYFEFARRSYAGDAGTTLGEVVRASDKAGVSLVLMRMPEVISRLRQSGPGMGEEAVNREAEALARIMDDIEQATAPTRIIGIFPPAAADEKTWLTPSDVASNAFDFQNPARAQGNPIEGLALLEKLPSLRDNPSAFEQVLSTFHAKVVDAARQRGEYSKVPLEVSFYRNDWIFRALVFYLISFVIVALSWMFAYNKWWRLGTQVSLVIPTVLLITGITIRCIIRERPPVSTLYETILFITACAVVTAIIIELMNRQRIIIALAAFLGCAGLFLANRYEAKEGVDTMPALIAVLDTNFWLSTHVTTVTLGYAAGLLAGFIAHFYIIGRLLGIRRHDHAFYRSITRMTYGVLCFGLLFATVGTILGGVWANDSWGRFWGWDPKENGALMICLWALIILHARMGGYIRDLGINMGAVVMNIVVTFSWWGVNNLGVGLHSYGFTSGLWAKLYGFWAVEGVVLAAGVILWLLGDNVHKTPKRDKAEKAPGTPEAAAI